MDMMRAFRAESPVREVYEIDDEQHWHALLDNMMAGAGAVFLEPGKGLLLCMVLPSVWTPKVLALHELAWYVKPEHRGGTTGHRLFREYVRYGKELKAMGRIRYFTVTKMVSSPALKFEKHGFRKVDENWIQ